MTNENSEKIKIIANHSTEARQIAKTLEELSELQQVLAKYLACGTSKDYKKNLVEELADVVVMLNQVIYLENVDNDDILETIDKKIKRQLKRINGEEE